MPLLRAVVAALAVVAAGLALVALVDNGDTELPSPQPLPRAPTTTPAPAATPAAHVTAQPLVARLRGLEASIRWRSSTSHGTPNAGSLSNSVRLPREGLHFFTWDPVRWKRFNRPERRHASDRLARVLLTVAREHARANPGAPRMAIGDLSRPRGGSFDATYGVLGEFGRAGTLGHVSHQNGLDADIYYPRRDGRERGPASVDQIDRDLAQDLVDRFVAAGAQFVFVGPGTRLAGPPAIVQPTIRHDDHMHVRLPVRAR